MFLKMRIRNIMKNYYNKKDGYRETINKGLSWIGSFSGGMSAGSGRKVEEINMLEKQIQNAGAIVVGAGSGLSTSAGFTYSGERFDRYFFDFKEKYGIKDMYSGGFYPFPDDETKWAWWARNIYFNRYVQPLKPVYKNLFSILKDKNYFIVTTNVDHQFQKAGFDKNRLFYTQGDYGLFQSVNPKIKKTYDNEEWVNRAMEYQKFLKNENDIFDLPVDGEILMKIPTELIPKCYDDNSYLTTNLRIDESFVEDEGWQRASDAYYKFLELNKDTSILYLELGVGANTPIIIKYPFWQMVKENTKAVYACINNGESFCPTEIEDRSICIDGDIGDVLEEIIKGKKEIKTSRLYLRKHRYEDADTLFEIFGKDSRMFEYSGWNPYQTREKAEDTINNFIKSYDDRHFYAWGIENDGRLIGTIGAYDFDESENSIEIGISIEPFSWGKGYATEALKAVLSYLTNQEKINVVKAWCAADNIGSQKSIQKAGMKLVDIEKNTLEINGKVYDKLNFEYFG